MNASPRLDAALARLEARIDWERRDRSAGWRVDLAPIRDLVERAEWPCRSHRTCHVAGSKGKGSVASLIAAGLGRAGFRTGVFSSPHVERVHERIRVDGRPVDDAALAAALEEALEVVERAEAEGSAGAAASWFDIVTLAAFCAFRRAGVDWAVVEVGLGGRLDSTNVIDPPELAVVTTIELEHTAILGDTHAAIAAEKGGIIKRGSRLVTGTPSESDAGAVLAGLAAGHGVPHDVAWSAEDRTFEQANVRVARAALDALGDGTPGVAGDLLGPSEIAAARLPGRMEWFEVGGVAVLLDGAHVASSVARALSEAVSSGPGPWAAVVAVHGEKGLAELLAPLARAGVERVLATTVPGSGVHHPAAAIGAAAGELGLEHEVHEAPEGALESALRWAGSRAATCGAGEEPRVIGTGSLYLAGALRPLLAAPASPS